MSATVQTQRRSGVRLGRLMRRGLTMIEGLFVLGIVAVMFAGLTALYNQWSEERKAQESVKLIRQITEIADRLVGGDPMNALGGANTRIMNYFIIASGELPHAYSPRVSDPSTGVIGMPYNPRATNVNVWLVAPNHNFFGMTVAEPYYHIAITGAFPKEACRRFMSHLMSGAVNIRQASIQSGGAAPIRTAPQTPASIETWCTAGASGGNAGLDISMTIPVAR